MLAIYKREFKSYLYSMTGSVFIAFITFLTGIYFMAYNLHSGYPYFAYALEGIMFPFMVAVPVLTMRSFSEERKSKTDQLLLTSPVGVGKMVMGKYLAMVTVFVIPCVLFCAYPLIIKTQGKAYFMTDYTAILVFFLLGCVYIAIGCFLSALTESQIIAAISTFGVLMLIYLWDGLLDFLPSSAAGGMIGIWMILTIFVLFIYNMTKNIILSGGIEIAGTLGLVIVYFVKSSVYENILSDILGRFGLTQVFYNVAENNLLDIQGVILYLTIAGVFLFLTVQVIQKRRFS
nr:ABC transporter permease [uncultured Sellimonas sp.]